MLEREIPDKINHLSFGEMREGLKNVKLKGFPDVKPYQFATITLEKLDPNYLHPVQNYVLRPELMKVKEVRDILFDNFGVNILDLNSSIDVYYGEEIISVLPVIIEEHIGNNGRIYNLVADGAHRTMIARLEQSLISCVYIRGINKAFRYYSEPRLDGWNGIDILDSIAPGYLKKWYAMSEPKKYYRDFNSSVFHNVGQGRGYSGGNLSEAGRKGNEMIFSNLIDDSKKQIFDPPVDEEKIKRLREKTGMGMKDCKEALIMAAGDLDEAVEIMRKKGFRPI